MIEKTIIAFLAERLSVPVSAEVPPSPPGSFVVFEKTGSGRENQINTATVALQSYGENLLAAAELNDRVKHVMDELPELDDICKANLNSDYNFTDTSTKRYRYQAVYDITHY